jgi:hypothetical protein
MVVTCPRHCPLQRLLRSRISRAPPFVQLRPQAVALVSKHRTRSAITSASLRPQLQELRWRRATRCMHCLPFLRCALPQPTSISQPLRGFGPWHQTYNRRLRLPPSSMRISSGNASGSWLCKVWSMQARQWRSADANESSSLGASQTPVQHSAT